MSARQEATDTIVRQWLSFRISGQRYAIALGDVSEVIREGELTPVPGAARELLGIRYLRGRIVPVLDGRLRLGLPAMPAADIALVRIVVLAQGDELVGLRVDAVDELLSASEAQIMPPPSGRGDPALNPVHAVLPWQGIFVALLDVTRLCRLGPGNIDAA